MSVTNTTAANLGNVIAGFIEDWVLEDKKKTAKGLLKKLAMRTPYRTGQAKVNWVVSNNTPDLTFTQVPENAPLGITFAERLSIAKGNDMINKAKAYNLTYIQNNAPYIGNLNNGTSMQAPALFVDAATLEQVNEN